MKKIHKMLYLKLARMGKGSNSPVPSIISFGTKIKGNILGGDIIHIDGKLDGNICCEELVIGVKGQVSGQVRAKNMSIYGTLQGSVEAEKLFVAGTAKVEGDVYHKTLAVEPGAYIDGRCIRSEYSEASNLKQVKTPSQKTDSNSALFKAVSGGK